MMEDFRTRTNQWLDDHFKRRAVLPTWEQFREYAYGVKDKGVHARRYKAPIKSSNF